MEDFLNMDDKELKKLHVMQDYGIDISRMDDIVIKKLPETDEEWLAGRGKYLGGSEAAAILNRNPYESPLSIYAAKVDGRKKDLSKVVSVIKGKELEDFILENKFKPKYTDYRVVKPNHLFTLKKYPFIAANLDGIAVPKDENSDLKPFINEIKYTSSYGEQLWDDGIPDYYWIQTQQYMHILGMETTILGVLKESTWQMTFYEIEYDADFCNKTLIPALVDFWENHIVPKIPPKASSKDPEYLKKEMEDIKEFTEDVNLLELAEQYTNIKEEMKQLKKKENELKELVVSAYTDGRIPPKDDFKVSLSVVERFDLDTARIKEDYPEIAKQCVKDVTYSTLRVTKKKK